MILRKIILPLFLLALAQKAAAQYDSTALKTIYDRCLDFDESRRDSLSYYAELIESESTRINYVYGKILSLRLKGIHAELLENYEDALKFILQSLDESRKLGHVDYESAALSDLAILYSRIKQPLKARDVMFENLKIAQRRGELYSLTTCYGNLGAIFNQLGMYDSARHYLREALRLSEKLPTRHNISVLYNNMGNVYFKTASYDSALQYFRMNLDQHRQQYDEGSLWLDYLNIADVFIEKKEFQKAERFADSALRAARHLGSKSKESDSYAILAKLAERKQEYAEAYKYLKLWYTLDTSLVNSETNQRIADLQERFNAQKREDDNRLLMAELKANKARQKGLTILLAGFLIGVPIISYALIAKRRANKKLSAANELMHKQNEKLAILNQEKNSLISMVSHDLSSPFVNIMMWGQLLQADTEQMTEAQQKALDRILTSAAKGEQLIRTILNIEKVQTNSHPLNIEPVQLVQCVKQVTDQYTARAIAKKIRIHLGLPKTPLPDLMSDAHIIERILDNLLSNALKYSHPHSNVYVDVYQQNDKQVVSIRDEGTGIDKEEIPTLFTKYNKLSSRPSAGENSTGLGLFIVKRLTDELQGKIECESEKGKGTTFRLFLS